MKIITLNPAALFLFACLVVPIAGADIPFGAPPQPGETFEQLETRLDATVWRDEVLAQKYERAFTKLWDDFRAASSKIAVLAQFPFGDITLPKVKGPPAQLGLGITSQQFDTSMSPAMPHDAWFETVRNLYGSGWRARHCEWAHEKFTPPRGDTNAWSEFSFEIFGERLTAKTRFILKGILWVEWEKLTNNLDAPHPAHLKVSSATVMERAGDPAFTEHAVVTPNMPERQGDMVNMHPVIVTDIDLDGDDDIILSGVNQLFLNDGKANFTPMEFIADSAFRGSMDAGLVADFNGDGMLDFITVAKQGALTNKIVIYPGNGSVPFKSEPFIANESVRLVAPSVMTAADIDQDGDLDLWVGQYKPPYKAGQLPTPYYNANDGYHSFLLINDGHGKFELATNARGLGSKSNRRVLGGSFADLNGDNHMDLLTINDYAGVDLFYNDGSAKFTDESARLYNPHLFGMGHVFADFDHDGILDFLAIGMSVPTVRRLEFMKLGWDAYPDRNAKRADMGFGNRIYTLRDGKWIKPSFADQLAATGWSWGVSAFDFDNSGDLDVYIANGHISGASVEDYDSHIWTHDIYVGNSREDQKLLYYFDKPFRGINTGRTSSNGYQHNALLMDTGGNNYVNVAWLMGVAHESDCRVVVSADLNSDGRMDLVLTEGQWLNGPSTGRNRLWIHLNQLQTTNHWIGVRLASAKVGVSPIGAKVWIKTPSRTFVRQLITGDSYQSQHPNTVHFGLGSRPDIDQIVIRWPNGVTNIMEKPVCDGYHVEALRGGP
jgi:hypothetical protein